MAKTFFVLWLLLAPAAFSGEVKEVDNSRHPVGKVFTLQLEEDLRIGPETDDEHFLWGGLGGTIAVNDQGHMFVVDPANVRIVEADANGVYVRDIGGQGQGPGEFQALTSFQILGDGSGVAYEFMGVSGNFSFFDKDMHFRERKAVASPGLFLTSCLLSANGEMNFSLTAKVNQAESKIDMTYMLLDKEHQVKAQLLTFDQPIPTPQTFSTKEGLIKLMAKQFGVFAQGNFCYAVFGSDHVYTATANRYEITKWDADFNKTMVIRKEYKPIAQGEDEIYAIIDPIYEALQGRLPPNLQAIFTRNTLGKAMELAEFPSSKHPINGLNLLKDGILVVVHNTNVPGKKMVSDLFSKEGKFLGSFEQTLSGNVGLYTSVFKGDFFYNMEVNEDGETSVVRYKYKLVAK